jgi:hypothetical protein
MGGGREKLIFYLIIVNFLTNEINDVINFTLICYIFGVKNLGQLTVVAELQISKWCISIEMSDGSVVECISRCL